jgi:hypothetical protein
MVLINVPVVDVVDVVRIVDYVPESVQKRGLPISGGAARLLSAEYFRADNRGAYLFLPNPYLSTSGLATL